MKNSALTLLFSLIFSQSFGCAWWDPEYEYYNLFAQTAINSPMYEPFLLVLEEPYFGSDAYNNQQNENIEDWQRYFGISYSQAYYLVFKADREEVQKLAKGNSSSDVNLKFIDSNFKTKFKQALLYLAYAKYLEPYMAFKRSGQSDYNYYWTELPEKTVADLDYSKVTDVLTKSWNAETDKDLKLRYGYQLVRFAHYYQKYDHAISWFNQYVESLNYKTIMYYYALDQKGGAERALGNYLQANYDFFQFFTHTKNRKTDAYTSMKITQDLDFEKMLKSVKTDNERFDLYMLLGYRKFNDPINELKKIISISADAVQTKVLMAREVNSLEREYLPIHYYCDYNYETSSHDDCLNGLKDKRLPVALNPKLNIRLNSSIEIAVQQSKNAKEKDFWNLTAAYLYFLKKDYLKSSEFLAKVNASNPVYKNEKSLFEMLLEITTKQKIDADFEKLLLKKYSVIFEQNSEVDTYYQSGNSTKDFVIDILANRYFLQNDYAKSFLLQNYVSDLEANPDMSLLKDIKTFYYKKDKNEFEQWLKSKVDASFQVSGQMKNRVVYDFESWVANMEGTMALAEGDFMKALNFFKEVNPKFSLRGGVVAYDENWNPTFSNEVYNGFSNIPDAVFGYNRIECFECPLELVMNTEFTEDFPLIKKKMNKKELTEALIQLDEAAKKKGETAAKAGYLLGNFYFNTTILGYFRELLTFDVNNSNGPKFHDYNYSPEVNVFYFKAYGYRSNYQNHFELPFSYLETALANTDSPEMKARILFTLSKCEQGAFYNAMDTDSVLKNLTFDWNNQSAYEQKVLTVKTGKYRKYFKELKKYSSTGFYKEVKSNCKYFDYYSTHY
ncbi:MAG: hypothetical protein H3C39_03180 [Flavobacteriia bacterium]|nr:hypothetical protein [Flavobacteriia bacterium]